MKNFISSAIKSLTPEIIIRIAIESGFQKREPKKLTAIDLLNLYCLESIDKAPSYNDIAGYIDDLRDNAPSRQAVGKRINKSFSKFLEKILEYVINEKIEEDFILDNKTECFPRIIVQDSTIVKLPIRLFNDFSGVSNGHTSVCNARIQGVYDLISKSFIEFSIDKYSENDLTAANKLKIENGDLILRDRGYLKSAEIERFINANTLYIYRHMSSMIFRSIESDKEVDLKKILTDKGSIDITLALNNNKRTRVRVVAVPVGDEIANTRRMKAKKETKGHNPSKRTLFYMGWTIFITNLPKEQYSFAQIFNLYKLRWRIEIIFKTWKSNMSFSIIHNVSHSQLHALLMARFIIIIITMHSIYRVCEDKILKKSGRFLSLCKLMRYIQCDKKRLLELILMLKNNFNRALNKLINYCVYDKRNRLNFVYEQELTLRELFLS